MKNTEYAKKLRDPRWQKKRLEVMEKAQWKCERCNASDKELQVHHGMYEFGLDPWDYDTSVLWCLCKRCHEDVTEMKREMQRYFGLVMPSDYELIGNFTKTIATIGKTKRYSYLKSWPPSLSPVQWDIIGKTAEWSYSVDFEQEGIK